jgi:quinol monooxygenase YgiN
MSAAASIHRIDKFVVPPEAVPAFVAQMQHIQQTLRRQPGCLRQLVLTQSGGSGEFNVLTLVEWESREAIAAAQQIVQKQFAEEGFDPAAFTRSLGVRADLGFYERA